MGYNHRFIYRRILYSQLDTNNQLWNTKKRKNEREKERKKENNNNKQQTIENKKSKPGVARN